MESLFSQKAVCIYILVLPRSFFRGDALQCVEMHNIYIKYIYIYIYIYIIYIYVYVYIHIYIYIYVYIYMYY